MVKSAIQIFETVFVLKKSFLLRVFDANPFENMYFVVFSLCSPLSKRTLFSLVFNTWKKYIYTYIYFIYLFWPTRFDFYSLLGNFLHSNFLLSSFLFFIYAFSLNFCCSSHMYVFLLLLLFLAFLTLVFRTVQNKILNTKNYRTKSFSLKCSNFHNFRPELKFCLKI